ncbi:MAG: hypothetical protein V4685_16435 [Bacteroidota bacterium]
MKKSILIMLVSCSGLVAASQTPDSTRQQQLNASYPPDSTLITPQVAPVEAAPVTTTPDTLNIVPATPVNTDVRNQPLTDTASMPATAESLPATQGSGTEGSTTTTTEPTTPVSTGAEGSNPGYNLTRGVNNPDASTLLTGLAKWSALPILNTYVPQEMVDKLKMEHGDKLYDITMLKTGENQFAYSARVQESGVYRIVMANDNASMVMPNNTVTPNNSTAPANSTTVPNNNTTTPGNNTTIPKQ